MIFRSLDSNGDWNFGQGLQSFARDEPAVELNLATRLRFFKNDCFWAMDAGIDWWNLTGQRNPAAQTAIVVAAREVVATSFGVVRINSLEAATDRTTRQLSVQFNVDTIFSRDVVGTAAP